MKNETDKKCVLSEYSNLCSINVDLEKIQCLRTGYITEKNNNFKYVIFSDKLNVESPLFKKNTHNKEIPLIFEKNESIYKDILTGYKFIFDSNARYENIITIKQITSSNNLYSSFFQKVMNDCFLYYKIDEKNINSITDKVKLEYTKKVLENKKDIIEILNAMYMFSKNQMQSDFDFLKETINKINYTEKFINDYKTKQKAR